MVPMVLVCVHELDTRSRVPFSTSYDQVHTYGTYVNMSISWSDDGHESRLQSIERSYVYSPGQDVVVCMVEA